MITWSRDGWKPDICTPMAPKLVRVVNYSRGTLATNLWDLLITWQRKKWKTLYLHFYNFYGPQTRQQISYLYWVKPIHKVTISLTTLPRGNWKNLDLHCNKIYSSPAWQGGDLLWGNTILQVIWKFDYIAKWSPLAKYF